MIGCLVSFIILATFSWFNIIPMLTIRITGLTLGLSPTARVVLLAAIQNYIKLFKHNLILLHLFIVMEIRWQMANENHMITFKTSNRSSVEYLFGLRWISHINQKQLALLLFSGVRINVFDVYAENRVIGRNLIIFVLNDMLCSLKSPPLIVPHTQIDHIKCFVDWVGFEAVEIIHRSLSSICRVELRIFSEEVMHCSTHCVFEFEETDVECEVLLFVGVHRIQLAIQIPNKSCCQSNSIITMRIFEVIISGQFCLLLSFGVMIAEHGMRFSWLPLSTCHHADVFTL